MASAVKVIGKDIPIDKLIPLNARDINLKSNRGFRKIISTLNTIGMIEPLSVYKENGHYIILDGFLRYKACEHLGIGILPCMLYRNKEAYTFNRMVNRLSPSQESRMLRESLKDIDQATIAKVFGIRSIQYRLGTAILKHLHPGLIKAIDKNLMSRRCAAELTYVNQERQIQILKEMGKTNDYSISFARALIIKTPPKLRNRSKKHKKPWLEKSEKKQELVTKLETIEKRHDFYTNLYRQYSTDLLKLCVYVRKIITNERIRPYLESNYPDTLVCFEEIVFESGGRKAV
ncbi:ParB/RepB/Spo0J family partition protein [Planctomycetota bacterium]